MRKEIEAPTVHQMEGLFPASQGKIQDKVVVLAEPENKSSTWSNIIRIKNQPTKTKPQQHPKLKSQLNPRKSPLSLAYNPVLIHLSTFQETTVPLLWDIHKFPFYPSEGAEFKAAD